MSYELIFSSRATSYLRPGEVPAIVQHARVRNRRLNITGLMAFDGARFCQLLEGAAAAVDWLAAIIGKDPRHTDFTVLHAGPQIGPRRFPASPMAFAMYDTDSLDRTIAANPGALMADCLHGTHAARIDDGL